jgi:hypothetical protein
MAYPKKTKSGLVRASSITSGFMQSLGTIQRIPRPLTHPNRAL